MNRQVARAAGVMLVAGLGGWSSQAFSQGAMTPRPPDVAPRAAPPPPVVAPTPPPMVTPAPPMASMAPAVTGARLSDGHAKLPNVGVTASGPGGVMQIRSDSQGVTPLGKLPSGNTIVEFNGADLSSALRATGVPTTPTPQKVRDHIVIVAILAIKIDGTPVVFTATMPASDVKTLKANLRVGRDGNLMDVDWGNGPQQPQALTKLGAGTLVLGGASNYSGATSVNQGVMKTLRDRAAKGAPGLVEANNIVMDVSTTQ